MLDAGLTLEDSTAGADFDEQEVERLCDGRRGHFATHHGLHEGQAVERGQRAWKRAQLALNARLGAERVAALHELVDDCLLQLDGGELGTP